jgi:hypothetical protein
MGMHPDAIQSFGVCSAVSKESKPEAAIRSLPYPCCTDGLLVNNGKSTVGSNFQSLDNHRLQNCGTEKYPYDYRNQNADHEKCSYSQKVGTDLLKHSNSKLLDHVGQNMITIQRESGYESNSVCGNPVCHTATLVNKLENHSKREGIPTDSDVFMTNHFTAKNSVNNLKSEDMDNKHSDSLPDPVLESESQETGGPSIGSPVNISSDSALSEPEETDIFTSKVPLDCNYSVKRQIEVDVKDEKDDGKSVFDLQVTSSLKKMPHERKQKYPARCDIRSEESETTSVSLSDDSQSSIDLWTFSIQKHSCTTFLAQLV